MQKRYNFTVPSRRKASIPIEKENLLPSQAPAAGSVITGSYRDLIKEYITIRGKGA
jgi:hypothetical protein